MTVDQVLNGGFTGLVCRGVESVPNDPRALLSYLNAVRSLLWEKANEDGGSAEVDTLIELQEEIGRRAADGPAPTLDDVLDKLEIWDCVTEAAEDETERVANALIRSVIADLERLAGRGARVDGSASETDAPQLAGRGDSS